MLTGPYRDAGAATAYGRARTADPRISAVIQAALGPATSVVNVGAGTGSHEPTDREVIAVEPSDHVIARRPDAAAPVLLGHPEQLPLAEASVDAALASYLHDGTWARRQAHLVARDEMDLGYRLIVADL
jgi:hypothetical protein